MFGGPEDLLWALYDRIVTHGAVVSEFPPGMRARRSLLSVQRVMRPRASMRSSSEVIVVLSRPSECASASWVCRGPVLSADSTIQSRAPPRPCAWAASSSAIRMFCAARCSSQVRSGRSPSKGASTAYLRRIIADVWGADLTVVEREFTLVGVVPDLDGFKDQAAQFKDAAHAAAAAAGKALAAA